MASNKSSLKRSQSSIITMARRTESVDAKKILKFIDQSTLELFGPTVKEIGKIFELIEKSILSITLEDQVSGRVLAQACFYDYPNVQHVAAKSWESWLGSNYGSAAAKNNSLNTLFLHFFAAQKEFSMDCAREVINNAFKAVPECHYILLCVPQGKQMPSPAFANLFVDMKSTASKPTSASTCSVMVANRDKFIPVLHIRESNVNDNDDLSPLLNSYTDLLKATYGDFYVAEMIEAQNEANKCLTAEVGGFGIGFMAITLDVNATLLNECFELMPFHGLRKPHADDILSPHDERAALRNSNEMAATQKSSDALLDEQGVEVKRKLSEVDTLHSDVLDEGADATSRTHQSTTNDTTKSLAGGGAGGADGSHGSRTGSAMNDTSFVPKYCGESNAFAIQLFCIEEKYDCRSMDFLHKAFQSFPDKDFCLITLPPNVPEFALIQNFLRVTPRGINKLNHELYLFHRNGIVNSFEVREADRPDDLAKVAKLVDNIESKTSIMRDLACYARSRKDANGIAVQAFVAESLGRVVGVAVVRQEEDIDYLRAHYQIEDFILFNHHRREEHAHINHFALTPVFSFLTKLFMREIMRISGKTCLYYPIYPEYASDYSKEKYSLITAVNFMVPVRHRTQIEYNQDKLGVNAIAESVREQKYNYVSPCALYHINRKLLLEPKIGINLRIVVVGASEVGVSFLESLSFCPHLRFNNLTLVSTHGLPDSLKPDELREGMRAHTLNYNSTTYATISLRSWVNLITGQLTAIDRRRKHVVINDRTILPYDHLVLCTGEQYYHVAPLHARVYNDYSHKEVKAHPARQLFDHSPLNMFTVNTEHDAHAVLTYIEKHKLLNTRESVIVHGMDLNALSTIQTLLRLGIHSNRILVVADENPLSFFNNPHVATKIAKELSELEIRVYESMDMLEWNDGQWKSGQTLHKVMFEQRADDEHEERRRLVVNCCLLLCFYKKNVDYTLFKAVNNCHLVYDGRLVIDNDYHTNDSCIRASGKLTKYKRAYYVDSLSHANFNQKEIGADLAFKILEIVDPVLAAAQHTDRIDSLPRLASEQTPFDENVLIKMYKKPIVLYTMLPGNYHYFHVTKPGPRVSYSDELGEREELVTNTDNGYFRIHLDKHKCVQTITCLSRKKIPCYNLVKLYGLNDQYLNKLVLKYNQGRIADLYSFFSESWCLALYHDRFEELCNEIRDISIDPKNGIRSVNDLLKEMVDNDLMLTKSQCDQISEHFVRSSTRSLIEKRLLSYLNHNSNHLPMFAKPDMV